MGGAAWAGLLRIGPKRRAGRGERKGEGLPLKPQQEEGNGTCAGPERGRKGEG